MSVDGGTPSTRAARIMYVLGPVILVAVGGWYAFSAVDSMGLSSQTGSAVVTGKEHRAAGKTYRTTVINNRTVTIPETTPEAYVLTLALDGDTTVGVADREVYEQVRTGDRVSVTYQRRRITGGLQVVKVGR